MALLLQHVTPNVHHGSTAAAADGRLARRICFTTPLSGSMGPKQAECEEEYTLAARSADAFLVSMAARTPNVGTLMGVHMPGWMKQVWLFAGCQLVGATASPHIMVLTCLTHSMRLAANPGCYREAAAHQKGCCPPQALHSNCMPCSGLPRLCNIISKCLS